MQTEETSRTTRILISKTGWETNEKRIDYLAVEIIAATGEQIWMNDQGEEEVVAEVVIEGEEPSITEVIEGPEVVIADAAVAEDTIMRTDLSQDTQVQVGIIPQVIQTENRKILL